MEQYYIFIDAGDQVYLLGSHGDYVTSIEEAMWFSDILEAKLYVERRGLERITDVRKILFKECYEEKEDFI